MDQVFIDALVNQALTAYKTGGEDGLKRWINDLPLPHQQDFHKYCAETLRKAIEAMSVEPADEAEPTKGPSPAGDSEASPTTDPRKKHTRDRRRTKPL